MSSLQIKQEFQATVGLIQQVLCLDTWKIDISWQKEEHTGSHFLSTDAETKTCVLICNELWLVDDKKIATLVDAVIGRMVELATIESQSGLDKQRKLLHRLVRGITMGEK